MFKRKAKNIVPDDYEFSREYSVTVKFKPPRDKRDRPWTAECIDSYTFAMAFGMTKEEAIIRLQNKLYEFDYDDRMLRANPSETFTIPPIRKF